jgi:hypothetical protein
LRFGEQVADTLCRLKKSEHKKHQTNQKYEHKNTRMLGE